MVGLIYFLLFSFFGVLEAFKSVPNAFVMFTVSAVFLKGTLKNRRSYHLGASIIGFVFGVISILSMLSSYIVGDFTFSYGFVGLFTLPYLLYLLHKKDIQ